MTAFGHGLEEPSLPAECSRQICRSAKALQTVLGHGSATFSLTVYGHLFDDDLDALAGRLDDLRDSPDDEGPAAHARPSRGHEFRDVAR